MRIHWESSLFKEACELLLTVSSKKEISREKKEKKKESQKAESELKLFKTLSILSSAIF